MPLKFNLPSSALFLDTLSAGLIAGFTVDSTAHWKHLFPLSTLMKVFFFVISSGRRMYEFFLIKLNLYILGLVCFHILCEVKVIIRLFLQNKIKLDFVTNKNRI